MYKKIKSPSSKDGLCQVWLKYILEQQFWRYLQFVIAMHFHYNPLLSPLERRCDRSFQHTRVPFTQGYSVPSLVEIGQVVLEKKIFKSRQCIFSMWLVFPLEKCMALNLNKFEFPLSKNTLCNVWLKLAQQFWRRFSKVVNIFQFFLWSSLRKRARSKTNPFNPRMVCAKFG